MFKIIDLASTDFYGMPIYLSQDRKQFTWVASYAAGFRTKEAAQTQIDKLTRKSSKNEFTDNAVYDIIVM